MQKLSGLVLDLYDDHDGAELRSLFPLQEEVPEIVKEAHLLSPEEHTKLPDDVFALVMLDEGRVFRKYACVDEGNTAMAVGYFLRNGHKITAEAQKVAAQNLVTACGWYDIEPPEKLEKLALGIGSALMGALVVPGAYKESKKNLDAVRGAGSQIVTPQQIKARRMQMGT